MSPGMTKKTATAPSSAPVEKREKWVLWPRPKNSTEKSIAIGTAATKSHFLDGVSVDRIDLTKG